MIFCCLIYDEVFFSCLFFGGEGLGADVGGCGRLEPGRVEVCGRE